MRKHTEVNEDDNQKPVLKGDNTPVTSDSKNVDLDTRYCNIIYIDFYERNDFH